MRSRRGWAAFAIAAMSVAAEGSGGSTKAPSDLEALRPRFHFTPKQNFMNDPNGLVFYKGEYPSYISTTVRPGVGPHDWGHAVSADGSLGGTAGRSEGKNGK